MKNKRAEGKLNIIVSGSPFYGNFGSMAMVVATIKKLSRLFPKAIFFKGSIFRDSDIRNYRKVFTGKQLKIYGFNGERFSIKFTNPLLLLFSIPYFRQADFIVEIPGEITSDISLFSQYARFLLAKTFKKPFIIFGCSLGSYKYRVTELLAREIFKKTDLLVVRENRTSKYLNKIGVNNYFLTADTAFLLKKKESEETKKIIKKNEPYIGLSIKGPYLSFLNYEKIILKIIEFLLEKTKDNILIIPHSQDDIQVSNKIFQQANSSRVRILKNNELTPGELKEIISCSNFYIGSRIHACIAAVSSQVPTIFLVPRDDHRGQGTMEFFNLDQAVINPNKGVTLTLKKVEETFDQKEKIKEKIIKHLPEVEKLSRRNFSLLEKFIDENI